MIVVEHPEHAFKVMQHFIIGSISIFVCYIGFTIPTSPLGQLKHNISWKAWAYKPHHQFLFPLTDSCCISWCLSSLMGVVASLGSYDFCLVLFWFYGRGSLLLSWFLSYFMLFSGSEKKNITWPKILSSNRLKEQKSYTW